MVLETLAEAILGNDKNDPSKMANRRMCGYQNCVKTCLECVTRQALLVFYERCLEMLRNQRVAVSFHPSIANSPAPETTIPSKPWSIPPEEI